MGPWKIRQQFKVLGVRALIQRVLAATGSFCCGCSALSVENGTATKSVVGPDGTVEKQAAGEGHLHDPVTGATANVPDNKRVENGTGKSPPYRKHPLARVGGVLLYICCPKG